MGECVGACARFLYNMEHRGRTIQRFEMGLPAVLYEKGVGRHIIRTDERNKAYLDQQLR